MLISLLSIALAQDVPLIDTLPPPPPLQCANQPVPGAQWPEALTTGPAAQALQDHLFPPGLDRADKNRAGVRTDGFVVIHDGTLIFEAYAPKWSADRRHLTWSASKTVMGALTGIAVREQVLTVDDAICEHADVGAQSSCDITVKNLLQMGSGLDWRETYEGESPTSSSVLAMLYGEGSADMARFVTGHPQKFPPGTHWSYSSGDTNALSAVVDGALSGFYGDQYPWPLLFEPLGMSPTFERDARGTFVGSSWLWATPRDMARFGLLLQRDGCWGDTPVLPEGWVARSTQLNDIVAAAGNPDTPSYGWQTWLNRPVPPSSDRRWDAVDSGAFAALGHWGQSVTVVPSHDLVVVRMADDRDGSYDHNETLARVLALLEMP